MEELYSIMEDLLDAEYDQKSLLYVLDTLDAAYGEEEQSAKLITHHTRNSLEALQVKVRAAIERLDHYIASKAERQSSVA